VTRAGVVDPVVAPGLKKSSVADRILDSEDRQLDPLARPGVGRKDYPIRCVEAPDERSTALAQDARQPAVNPDLRVVIDDDLEHDCRTARFEGADCLGNSDRGPIPVETQLSGGPPTLERGGLDCLPSRVV